MSLKGFLRRRISSLVALGAVLAAFGGLTVELDDFGDLEASRPARFTAGR